MNYDSLQEKWALENAFWNSRERAETYCMEDHGSGYMTYPKMEKQYHTEWYRGDWVKSEDYMRDIERLEKLLKDNGIEF